MTVTLDDIRAAATAIAGQVVRTPCVYSRTLSAMTGAEIWLKLENMQYTASFKDRGALNRLLALDAGQRKAGVIAVSAGNHAQGVAWHAQRLGIPATIVMPHGTPFVKVHNTAVLGARVVIEGESVSDAEPFALAMARRDGSTFVHPYDDPLIVAGQGTVALEVLEDCPEIEAFVVPIGGGGLIGGIATAAHTLAPAVTVYGVEAALYPSMLHAIRGLPAPKGGPTIAEGIAVKTPGRITRPIVERLVSDILLVEEAQIEQAVQLIVEIEKVVVEGAGAVALAAVLADPDRFAGRKVCLVLSGGNIDARVLASVLMRGLARSGRLCRVRVEISDQPGGLAHVTAILAGLGANVLEVDHHRWFYDVPVKLTEVEFLLETRNEAHVRDIVDGLKAAGIPIRRLSGAARTDEG